MHLISLGLVISTPEIVCWRLNKFVQHESHIKHWCPLWRSSWVYLSPQDKFKNSTLKRAVRFAASRPWVHSPGRAVSKNFKKWYPQHSCLALGIYREVVENKPASSLVMFLGKALNRTPSLLFRRQMAQFFLQSSLGGIRSWKQNAME